MAQYFQLYKKLLLRPFNFEPLCSHVLARRYISSRSLLCERTHSRCILKRLLYEKPLLVQVIPNTAVHHTRKNSYSTNTVENRNSFTSNTVENGGKELTLIFKSKASLSKLEWEEVLLSGNLLKEPRNKANLDVLVIRKCLEYRNWRLADSYFEYLELQGKEPSILSLACYLELCGEEVDDCGEEKVLEAYEKLSTKAKVFDSYLSLKACVALTKTSKWKEALSHIPVIERLSLFLPAKAYNAIISAAFRNGEYDTSWQFLQTMYEDEKLADPELYSETIIDYIRSNQSARNKGSIADTLFKKFSQYEIYPHIPATKEVARFFMEDIGWTARYVKIFNDGVCPSCNRELKKVEINEESFMKLREEFESRVIHNTNIYKSTDPEEWSRFKLFLEIEGPFTTIVDGLNVAYSVRKQKYKDRLERVREVVTKVKLSNRKGSILVIGRNHMENWGPNEWKPIKRRAKVFFLDNISKDDGFFIYAALCSGLGTTFITSDFLRNHLYRLKDPSLKQTFLMWQRQHQIFVVNYDNELHLVMPPKFATTAQKHGEEAWHIPYNDGSAKEPHEVPHTWLCLHANKENNTFHSSDIVSAVPFECFKEEKYGPGLLKPENFGLGTSNTNLKIMKLTGVIPGSDKRKESEILDIRFGKFENPKKKVGQIGSKKELKMRDSKYGKFQFESDSRIPIKPYGKTRILSKDYGSPPSVTEVSPDLESSQTLSQTKFGKSVGARKKMKENMMKIIKSKRS